MPGVLILENGLIQARIGVLIRPHRKEHQVNVGVNKLRPILSQRSGLGRTAELPNIPWRRLGWAHAQFSIGTVYDRCRWDLMSDHPNQTRTPYEPSQRRKPPSHAHSRIRFCLAKGPFLRHRRCNQIPCRSNRPKSQFQLDVRNPNANLPESLEQLGPQPMQTPLPTTHAR